MKLMENEQITAWSWNGLELNLMRQYEIAKDCGMNYKG